MSADLSRLSSEIAARGRITADDVLALRGVIFHDGAIAAAEAEALFDLDERTDEQDASWPALFIEALTDYLVHQAEPYGYVSRQNIDWLLARITRDGDVKTGTELALLVNVLDRAISAPDPLAVFALAQVKAQVLRANRIGAREVEMLRRVLYAAGGQKGIAITREEAEVIYDVHDARGGAGNDPAWNDLFVKVLLSHLMFASGYEPPTREEALRREAWLDDTSVEPGRFIGEMARSLPDLFNIRRLIGLYRAPSAWEEHLRARAEIAAAAEEITDDEAEWLAGRMLRDGRLSEEERALVAALKEEQPRLHPVIQAAVDRLA